MDFLHGIFILIIIVILQSLIAFKMMKKFFSTHDYSFLYFSLSISFIALHVLTYEVIIIETIIFESATYLKVGGVLAKALLNIGIVLFMQIPLYYNNKILKEHRLLFNILWVGVIITSSILLFTEPTSPSLSNKGFIIENISQPTTVISLSLLPIVGVILLSLELYKVIHKRGHNRLVVLKAILLAFGLLLAAIGQTIILTSHIETQSIIGTVIVLTGFIIIIILASFVHVRQLLTQVTN